jgi:hypothetical protein
VVDSERLHRRRSVVQIALKSTINFWKLKNNEFSDALKIGKEKVDDQVKWPLYHRTLGYSYDAVKVFMRANSDKPVLVPFRSMHRRTSRLVSFG